MIWKKKELGNIYPKEQIEYIKNHINKIRDSVEDKQSRMAWQTVNEVNRRMFTASAKLNEYNYENKILRIYSEKCRKLHMNQS